jgi:hypothetical protein
VEALSSVAAATAAAAAAAAAAIGADVCDIALRLGVIGCTLRRGQTNELFLLLVDCLCEVVEGLARQSIVAIYDLEAVKKLGERQVLAEMQYLGELTCDRDEAVGR